MTTSRVLVLAAAIAAPVLFVAGQALFPALGDDPDAAFALMIEHRDRLIVSRLLTAAGAYLLLATLWLVSRLGGTVTRTGAVIAGVGTFFNAVSQGAQGYAAWAASAPGLDHSETMPVLLHVEEGLAGLPVGYWSIPVFALGLVVLAIGLLTARSAPWWMPVLLLVGVLGAFLTAGWGPIVALTEAPLALSLIAASTRAGSAVAREQERVQAGS